MTKTEFESLCEDSWDVDDLISFCNDNELYEVTEDIYSSYSIDNTIDEDISNCSYGWEEIRDLLNDIPTGYDYYYCEGYLHYRPIEGSDFDWIKDSIETYMEGHWDEEEEDEEEEVEIEQEETYDYSTPVDKSPTDNEDISELLGEFDPSGLFNSCSGLLQTICDRNQQEELQDEENFKRNVTRVDINLSLEF